MSREELPPDRAARLSVATTAAAIGSATAASDIERTFTAFLEALNDCEGGARLYHLHAPEAILRYAQGIAPVQGIDCDAFSRAHRDASSQGAGRLPRFSEPVLLKVIPDLDESQSVAWFEVVDTVAARRCTAALGTRTSVAGVHIVWCTLAEQVSSWSFQDGLLQSLADYPWMRSTDPAIPRLLLDAAYFRRYWRPPIRFNALPEARFSCQMSTACCRHDYEITLPPEAQWLIDAIPWSRIGNAPADTRLPRRPDGQLQLKTNAESCRFLGADRRCLIHTTLGRQPFGPCCVFPLSFAQTPAGIDVGLSPICGSARRGLGTRLDTRDEDLRERLAHVQPRSTDAYKLAPGLEVPWEQFHAIETALCDCLNAGDLPLRQRLYLGSQLLDALKEHRPIDFGAWLDHPATAIDSDLRLALHGMLARILDCDRPTLRRLPRTFPDTLADHEIVESAELANILRNTLFCKVYSYPFDLTTAHNHLIVLYVLALIMQIAASRLSEEMWRELGSLGVHGLLKSLLHDNMPEGFRALLGTAQFGTWLLAV